MPGSADLERVTRIEKPSKSLPCLTSLSSYQLCIETKGQKEAQQRTRVKDILQRMEIQEEMMAKQGEIIHELVGKTEELSGLVRALATQRQEALNKSRDTCEVKTEEGGDPTVATET